MPGADGAIDHVIALRALVLRLCARTSASNTQYTCEAFVSIAPCLKGPGLFSADFISVPLPASLILLAPPPKLSSSGNLYLFDTSWSPVSWEPFGFAGVFLPAVELVSTCTNTHNWHSAGRKKGFGCQLAAA
jgi:hypothetical protein